MAEYAGSPKNNAAAGMRTALDELRKKLIDISKRNRLTNSRLHKPRGKQIDVYDERADEVFRILYVKRRKMRFKPVSSDGLEIPETDEAIFVPYRDEPEPAARHTDLLLQTRFTQEALQKKLLSLYRDASSMEEEQGISVLYLALGFLEWYESASSDLARYAPLVLLPVDLDRDSARGQFRLIFRDQDMEPNLSLQAMLKSDFGLMLPDFPEGDEWLPSQYFSLVHDATCGQSRWRVLANTIQLGFYSYAKFLMYRDLDKVGEAADAGLLNRILVQGFEAGPDVMGGADNLDERFSDPRELGHILDADASQTRVIDAARRGRNLVVQGPPGTGKSQTIANIVAAAARDGKRILFVAEKRAALDVVHARLEKCDLGPLCLELHSHKVSRKHVYAELKRTLELGRPREVGDIRYHRLREVRDRLNATSELLHKLDETSGQTPYHVMGTLSLLLGSDLPRPDYAIDGAADWSSGEFQERLQIVTRLAELTEDVGAERHHLWRGAGKRLGPVDRDRLKDRLKEAPGVLSELEEAFKAAAAVASAEHTGSVSAAENVRTQVEALAERPREVDELISNEAVAEDPPAAQELLGRVAACQQLRKDLLTRVNPGALELSWQEERQVIAARGTIPFFAFSTGATAPLRRASRVRARKRRPNLSRRASRYWTGWWNTARRAGNCGASQRSGRPSPAAGGRKKRPMLPLLFPAFDGFANSRSDPDQQRLYADRLLRCQADLTFTGLPGGCKRRPSNGIASGAASQRCWSSTRRLPSGRTESLRSPSGNYVPVSRPGRPTWTAWRHGIGSLRRREQPRKRALGPIREALAGGGLGPEHAPRVLEFLRAEAVWRRMCEQGAGAAGTGRPGPHRQSGGIQES